MPVEGLIGRADVLKTLDARRLRRRPLRRPDRARHPGGAREAGTRPAAGVQDGGFKDGVHELSDLQPGMVLEGVVTNVANFGAFVDIGVHQDGLVHVSQLAAGFVKDPREVVKAGRS